MCLDVPVLSSLIPERFATFALHEKAQTKADAIDSNKWNLYYSVASNKARFTLKTRNQRFTTQSISQTAQMSFSQSNQKNYRPSKFLRIYLFFLRYPLFQHVLFQILSSVLIALLSFFQDWMIAVPFDKLKTFLLSLSQSISGKIGLHIGYSAILGAASVFITAAFSPEAGSGSGIPDVIAIMSGVSFPQFFTFKTLLAKVFGCMFAASSGLFVGRTGPMCSTAVICAYLLMDRIPFFRNFLQTEPLKRSNYAFALAVGYAATMYSPIGGVLFSIELTSSVFLTRQYGRTFIAACIAGFVFRLLWYLDYSPLGKQPSAPTFPEIYELPLFLVTGVLIGFLPPLFIQTAKLVATFYKHIERLGHDDRLTSLDFPTQNIASFSGIKSSTVMRTKQDIKMLSRLSVRKRQPSLRALPPIVVQPERPESPLLFTAKTQSIQNDERILKLKQELEQDDPKAYSKKPKSKRVRSWWKQVWRRILIGVVVAALNAAVTIPYGAFDTASSSGTYLYMDMMRDPLPAKYLSSFGGKVNMFGTLGIVAVIKNVMIPLCMQIAVPAGIVTPSLSLGSMAGRLIGEFLNWLSPNSFHNPQTYAAVGAAAHLAGCTHSISAALLVMESTCMPNIGLPCVIGALCGHYISRLFGGSLFDILRDIRKIPGIKSTLPDSCQPNFRTVKDLMKTNTIFITPRPTLAEIRTAEKRASLMGASYVPLVRSKDDPILIGAVTVASLKNLLSNRTILERAILASIDVPPLISDRFATKEWELGQEFYQKARTPKMKRKKEKPRPVIPTSKSHHSFLHSQINHYRRTTTTPSARLVQNTHPQPSFDAFSPFPSSLSRQNSFVFQSSGFSQNSRVDSRASFSTQLSYCPQPVMSWNWNGQFESFDISDMFGCLPVNFDSFFRNTPSSHSFVNTSALVTPPGVFVINSQDPSKQRRHPLATDDPSKSNKLPLSYLAGHHQRGKSPKVQEIGHLSPLTYQTHPETPPTSIFAASDDPIPIIPTVESRSQLLTNKQLRTNETSPTGLEQGPYQLMSMSQLGEEAWKSVIKRRLKAIKQDEEMAVIEMNEQWVLVDSAPFQLSIDTTLNKAQGIFVVMSLQFCIVVDQGRYKGLLFRSDFEQVFRTEYDVQERHRRDRRMNRRMRRHGQSEEMTES
ncbi:putative Chloride channel protein 2 [Blattamonas nauphoetae]|uniref:Chloride channel protein 2 n=1 Tax=Blattamonas nauphoetae TaxID=2049346 RepID=A0ABQ9XJ95_9EUKA|nr:putative Chloride channel protein 2 [Blattamonas nauphoetae]